MNRAPLSFLIQDCGYETPCYVWRTTKTAAGYSMFKRNGTSYYAHRQVLIAFHGPLAKGIEACHRCDNRACIRPEHLFPGTHLDNMRDMTKKGRHRKPEHPPGLRGPIAALQGINHPMAVLNEETVRAIRARFASGGIARKELALAYGVSKSAVERVINRRTWSHLD